MSPQEFWRIFDVKARQASGGGKLPRAVYDQLRRNLNDPNWGKPDAGGR